MAKEKLKLYLTNQRGEEKSFELGVTSPLSGLKIKQPPKATLRFSEDKKSVTFGQWPQSKKAETVMIDERWSREINHWKCYMGSDRAFYIKEKVEGVETFFKMEPIEWLVLTEENGEFLLLAKKALAGGAFDMHWDREKRIFTKRKIKEETVLPNNYQYSRIRAYLNGLNGSNYGVDDFRKSGFIDKAFSESEKELLKKSSLDNGKKSLLGNGESVDEAFLKEGGNPYQFVGKRTQDKVFLLSVAEVTNEKYGFAPIDCEEKDALRIREATDYAIATGVAVQTESSSDSKNCSWFLRSPSCYYEFVARIVLENGHALGGASVSLLNQGIVPAIRVKTE